MTVVLRLRSAHSRRAEPKCRSLSKAEVPDHQLTEQLKSHFYGDRIAAKLTDTRLHTLLRTNRLDYPFW